MATRRRAHLGLALALGLLILPSGVAAQSTSSPVAKSTPPRFREPQGFVGGAVGAQVAGSDFTTDVRFTLYAEPATLETTYDLAAAAAFEVTAGARFWRQLGAVIAVSRYQQRGATTITGLMPHPFFENQPRAIDAAGPELERSETAVHVGVLWLRQITPRIVVAASAGPTFVRVQQEVVTGVALRETYPYDQVEISRPLSESRDAQSVGAYASGDVFYRLTRSVGIGGGGRFFRASADLDTVADQQTSIDVGGLQITAGVRWLF